MTPLALDRHADRFLPLQGTTNTRDLGGLPLAGGGTTTRGRVWRSDAPLLLVQEDLDALARIGLTTVIDLREASELAQEPNALAGHPYVVVHHVEVWRLVNERGGRPVDPFDITAFYVAALDHAGDAFAQGVRLLADASGAAVFHCTVGKDRTGLLAALVLEAVGVPRAAVLEDFALTHDRIDTVRERLLADAVRRGVDPQQFQRLLGATADLLEPALAHLDRRHGGAVAYLRAAGVDDATLARLRTKLAPVGEPLVP
ncbi:MAG: tyrosine-protein phosphatase [Trueperaceae bacterium]|nr:tyrosine-protein phosphatase [Trueperaceae bacterium]